MWGIDPARIGLTEPEDGVWAENVPAVRAFLAVSTQWRVTIDWRGVRRLTGLDYQGAAAGLRLAEIEVTPDIWAGVRAIEAGAIEEVSG